MKVIVLSIVVDAIRTILKSLQKSLGKQEIRGTIGAIQTTAVLISARILRRVLETCSHSDFN